MKTCLITTCNAQHAHLVLSLDHLIPTTLWEPCSTFSNLKYEA
jgi:hypothetical protein